MVGIDQLSDILREQHRRDLVLIDVDRRLQADRRANLSNMASELEQATEVGMHSIVQGSFALLAQANEMRTALEMVRTAPTTPPARRKARARMNDQATHFAEQVIAAIGSIAEQVERGSAASHDAVQRADGSRDIIKALAAAADDIGEIIGVINAVAAQTNLLGAQRHHRGGAGRRRRQGLCRRRRRGEVAGHRDRKINRPDRREDRRNLVADATGGRLARQCRRSHRPAFGGDQLDCRRHGAAARCDAGIFRQRATDQNAVSDVASRMAEIATMVTQFDGECIGRRRRRH